ncbi:MAG: 5'/3'-nucleotidase SurE [Conexivisphaerales archaeon]
MIILTNDDGVYSPGIMALAKSLREIANVKVVAPRGAQSSSGMSITFHRPLTMSSVKQRDYEATALTGTPADCVFVSIHRLFKKKRIDMIVSGINLGENVSMQSFFSSGTVSAAMSGSIVGIKSIAFSKVIAESRDLLTEREFKTSAEWAKKIVSFLLKDGFPPGVDLLNVNFPQKVTRRTKISITSMAKEVFEDYVIGRTDPRGNKYFWLAGDKKVIAERGTDAFATLTRGEISITPISVSAIQKESDKKVHAHLSKLLEYVA